MTGFDGKREHAEARWTKSEHAAVTTSREGRLQANHMAASREIGSTNGDARTKAVRPARGKRGEGRAVSTRARWRKKLGVEHRGASHGGNLRRLRVEMGLGASSAGTWARAGMTKWPRRRGPSAAMDGEETELGPGPGRGHGRWAEGGARRAGAEGLRRPMANFHAEPSLGRDEGAEKISAGERKQWRESGNRFTDR